MIDYKKFYLPLKDKNFNKETKIKNNYRNRYIRYTITVDNSTLAAMIPTKNSHLWFV